MPLTIPVRDVKPVSAQEALLLFTELNLMGNYYGLSSVIDAQRINQELKTFDNDWKTYNPDKPDYKRRGLSLTSLDGGLSGMPDLTSLLEYNNSNGTNYLESSFTRLTPVFEQCRSLHAALTPFLPYLARSHFLRFDRGGFFPYHRDYARPSDTFRLFIPLYTHAPRDFIFLLGREKMDLEVGRIYFINTIMEHALFTLDGPSTHLVLNVRLCRESVDLVQSRLASY